MRDVYQEQLTGLGSTDTLIGANIANTWNITSINGGSLSTLTFTGMENLVGGTYDVLGIKLQASRLLAGVVALLVTLGLHLLLTRTSLGSKMLAVAEDATAAQLMGIRPDSMQAIAWAIAAGATGLAGALIATFFYVAPTVGETLGIVAFVTVSLGGFGSVPGALVAGLLIGVIESVSAYWIGAVYKDIVVYSLFLCFLWFRPQGLMGKM